MSRRIRSIKPELLEDEKTAALSDSAFRIFIGLITMADDFGTFRADPRFIENQVYWYSVPEKAVASSLRELDTMVDFYTVRGQRYGRFRSWAKHQRVDNAAGKRTGMLPGPECADDVDAVSPRLAATRGDSPRDLDPTKEFAAGSDRIGSDGSGEERGTAAPEIRPEPQSETLVRAQPVPDPPDPDPVADALRAQPKLADLDIGDLASFAATRMVTKGTKLAWVLQAIEEAAEKSQRGELSHVRHGRVVAFIKQAKGPRREGQSEATPAHRDFRFDPGETRAARRAVPIRPKPAEDGPPLTDEKRAELAVALTNFGRGPPMGPSTEAQLRDKAQADQRRLAEMTAEQERKAGGA